MSVSAAPTFAAKWLALRLHAFQAAYPRLELRLRADDALTDPARDRQVDVAIRYGRGPYAPDLHAERLWPEGIVIAVCSPAIAAGYATAAALGRGASAQDGYTSGSRTYRTDRVERLVCSRRRNRRRGRARRSQAAPRVGTTQLALEAAVAGRGVALSPRLLVSDDLAQGRLTQLFATELPDPHAFWLLYRRERADEAPVRSFVTWLKLAAGVQA